MQLCIRQQEDKIKTDAKDYSKIATFKRNIILKFYRNRCKIKVYSTINSTTYVVTCIKLCARLYGVALKTRHQQTLMVYWIP